MSTITIGNSGSREGISLALSDGSIVVANAQTNKIDLIKLSIGGSGTSTVTYTIDSGQTPGVLAIAAIPQSSIGTCSSCSPTSSSLPSFSSGFVLAWQYVMPDNFCAIRLQAFWPNKIASDIFQVAQGSSAGGPPCSGSSISVSPTTWTMGFLVTYVDGVTYAVKGIEVSSGITVSGSTMTFSMSASSAFTISNALVPKSILSSNNNIVSYVPLSGGTGTGIKANVYDKDWNLVGSPISIFSSGLNSYDISGFNNGGFVVAISSKNIITSSTYYNLGAIVIDSNMNPSTMISIASSSASSNEMYPKVTTFSNGGFAVSWDSILSSSYDIKAQIVSSSKVLKGSIITASTLTSSHLYPVSISTTSNTLEQFFLSWLSPQDSQIYGDIFSAVVPCSAGYYSSTGNAPCNPAPIGTYVSSTGATSYQSCPSGTTTTNTGATSQSSCITQCAAGTYSSTGNAPCNPAPIGTYVSSTGATSYQSCPSGTTTATTGATSQSSCVSSSCTAGTYSSTGSIPCTTAANGGFTNSQTGATTYTKCPTGYYNSGVGYGYSYSDSNACIPAPIGSYVDSTGATSAKTCPSGTTTNTTGATSSSDCVSSSSQCSLGYYSSTGKTPCTAAPIGSYVDTTGATTYNNCPSGKTTSTTGATRQLDCISSSGADQDSNSGKGVSVAVLGGAIGGAVGGLLIIGAAIGVSLVIYGKFHGWFEQHDTGAHDDVLYQKMHDVQMVGASLPDDAL